MVESHLLQGWNFGLEGGDAAGGGRHTDPRSVYADRFPALKKLWDQFNRQSTSGMQEESIYQAHYIAGKGEAADPVAVFARDPRTGHQVWSASVGYPGDEWYLEFHRKHVPGGHRYHRVTGPGVDLGHKAEYSPSRRRKGCEPTLATSWT